MQINSNTEYQFSKSQKAALSRDLAALGNTYLEDPNRFQALARMIVQQYLPVDPLIMHEQVKNNSGFVVIRNLPIDDILPQTPQNGTRPLNKAAVTEAVLLGVVSALHYKPLAYTQEKEGAVVHEIAPVKAQSKSVSSNGILNFDFHTDGSHISRDIRPHILSLFCLRDTAQTPTKLCRLADALSSMDHADVLELMTANFIHTPPETFGYMAPVRGPILCRNGDRIEASVSTHNVQPQTTAAAAALEKFRECVEHHHQKIFWNPGDLLIFNNLRCLHARGEIKGDRWLQRCYGTENLNMSNVVDLSKMPPPNHAN